MCIWYSVGDLRKLWKMCLVDLDGYCVHNWVDQIREIGYIYKLTLDQFRTLTTHELVFFSQTVTIQKQCK